MKKPNGPEQLIGDSPETRFRQAVNTAYNVLVEHTGTDEMSNTCSGDRDFRSYIGTEPTGVRYLSFVLESDTGPAQRLDVDLLASGDVLCVARQNNFVVENDRVIAGQEIITGPDVLMLLDPIDLGTRSDLRGREAGLNSPEFHTDLIRALPGLTMLSTGDVLTIGGLDRQELAITKIPTADGSVLKFADTSGFDRLQIALEFDGNRLERIGITETDVLPVVNGFVDYRGGTAIDTLAAQVVSKLAQPEKKVQVEKPPRTSFKDRLRKIFSNNQSLGSYSTFGDAASPWKSEQMHAELPEERDAREAVAYINSVLAREDVAHGLEDAEYVELSTDKGTVTVLRTSNSSTIVPELTTDGTITAVIAETSTEVGVIGVVTNTTGEQVVAITRDVSAQTTGDKRVNEVLLINTDPSGRLLESSYSNTESPRVRAFGQGKLASRVRGFLKSFF